MKALLENVDLFAHKINFNYKKKNLYHSFFGMGLTFTVYGVMIYFVHYFSKDFVNNSNPKVIIQETELDKNMTIKLQDLISPKLSFNFTYYPQRDKDRKNVNFTLDTFGNFFLTVYTYDGRIKQSVRFNFTVDFYNYEINYWKEPIIKGFIDENSTFFSSVYEEDEIFDLEDVDLNHECPSSKKNFENITLNIQSGDEIVLQFVPKDWKNITSSASFDFKFSVKNYIINANSINFFKTYITDHKAEGFMYKQEDKFIVQSNSQEFNYGVVSLIDDRGFIFSEINTKLSLKLKYHSKPIKINEGRLNMFSFEIDRINTRYDRIYKKLQNVFSDLGGIMSSFILIGNILIVQFNKKKFDYDLINKVFKIEKDISKGQYEMRAPPMNQKIINSKDISDNSGSFEENSSRKLIKIDQNNNNISQQNRLNSVFNLEEIDCKFKKTELSLIKLYRKRPIPNDSKKENEENSNLNSISDENSNKEDPAKEKQLIDCNVDSFAKDFESGKLFNKPLKYTKKDFFKTFLCCNDLIGEDLLKKEIIFGYAQNQIYEYMDIVNFVKLFEKMESLISILFNEQQALSFNFIKCRQIHEIQSSKIDTQNIKKVIDYYRENKMKSNLSLIDERLLQQLYPSFSKLI